LLQCRRQAVSPVRLIGPDVGVSKHPYLKRSRRWRARSGQPEKQTSRYWKCQSCRKAHGCDVQ